MPRHVESPRSSENRRTFLKASAVAAGALAAGRTPAGAGTRQTLALNGGPKAVTKSSSGAARWPLYGPDEEKAILKLVKSPTYEPLERLEKDWKQYYKIP